MDSTLSLLTALSDLSAPPRLEPGQPAPSRPARSHTWSL